MTQSSFLLKQCSLACCAAALLMLGSSLPLYAQETLTQPKPAPKQEPAPPPAPPAVPMQSVRTLSIGGVAGYSMDLHTATDLVLPNVPSCCPGYSGGMGGGPIAGLSIELPVSPSVDLIGRLVYHTSKVVMETREDITVRVNNTPTLSYISHELTPTLSVVSFEPGVVFRVADGLSFLGGVRLGTVLSGTFEQQSVLDPSIPYDFNNGTGVRNQASGDIPQVSSFQFGLFAGARYALSLNAQKTMHLVPELQFAPLFTTLVEGEAWSMSSFRFMLGLQFSLMRMEAATSPLRPE